MNEKETKTNVQAQFGSNAENYVKSKLHAKGSDLTKLMEIVELEGDEYCLDIATGGGHTANAIAPFCKKVVALDLTREILSVASKFIESNGNENVEFVQGDAENLPFPDDTFDLITCRIAAHHFPNIADFVKETFRTLKKGGTFYLIDNVSPEKDDFDLFYNEIEKVRDYSHHRALKKSEWINIVEVIGFEMIESHCFPKTFIFEDWCRNMNVSMKTKNLLEETILQSSKELQDKFKVTSKDSALYSFTGESILIKVKKP